MPVSSESCESFGADQPEGRPFGDVGPSKPRMVAMFSRVKTGLLAAGCCADAVRAKTQSAARRPDECIAALLQGRDRQLPFLCSGSERNASTQLDLPGRVHRSGDR